SIVLRSGPGHPRLHSLLPETHLALVPEKNILPHISSLGPQLEKVLGHEKGTSPSCVNIITGPSRSADIALTLIKGVHGPRDVFAVIVPDSLTTGDL
ncbi:MAG: LUD domain-containing protein, partial [Nitrospinae bacterium]|nr:LUD domain-containing protein [Nitrospinota bacterium]